MEKLKIKLPIIVEGRYDKSALSGFVDAVILTTGGFSIFNNKEQQALLRKMARDGVILMTDSDGGGRQIRSFISGIIAPSKIHHLFIPKIQGKEKRKSKASAAGFLGVEGMDRETLTKLLAPFTEGESRETRGPEVTKLDFFMDGLSGTDGASEKRERLAKEMDLPSDMTAKALLEAVNIFLTMEEYKELVLKISQE